jgi:acyl-CoA hydrolase
MTGSLLPMRTDTPLIAIADGADGPRVSPADIASLVSRERPGVSNEAGRGPEVLLGWTPEDRPWLADPTLRGRTVMAGYALAGAVADGRVRYVPVRLSAIPRLLGQLGPDAVVVSGIRRGSTLAFRGTVGWGPAAATAAAAVLVEIDEDAPDLGGPEIPGHVVATIPRPYQGFERPPAQRPPDPVDLAIGRNVVSLLPEQPTLQFGPGGIGEGIVANLDRPVRIWSGLVTDSMASLAERGLLDGRVRAGYVFGGRPIADLAAEGRLELLPIEQTHDLTLVSALPRFVACNTALQVSLDGSVNVEQVGGRVVAGIGGHPDFCAAAARSPGGLSVIALRSVTRSGTSTIVPAVEVVSTPRCDVDVVVTEHGIADLRGLDAAERAGLIALVAAPEHRATLVRIAASGR